MRERHKILRDLLAITVVLLLVAIYLMASRLDCTSGIYPGC